MGYYTYEEVVGWGARSMPTANDDHIRDHVRKFFKERAGERVTIILGPDDVTEPNIEKVKLKHARYTSEAVKRAHRVVAIWDEQVRVLKDVTRGS